MLPQPAHRIPIWVGGSGPAAHRRAVELGDGFHLISVTPEQAAARIAPLRAERPEPEFVISLRTGWDPQGMEPDVIRAELEAYAEAGVSHVVAAPWRTDHRRLAAEHGPARRDRRLDPPLSRRRPSTRFARSAVRPSLRGEVAPMGCADRAE